MKKKKKRSTECDSKHAPPAPSLRKRGRNGVRTGSWTGPPRGKGAPRVGISSNGRRNGGVGINKGLFRGVEAECENEVVHVPPPYRGTSLIRNSTPP